MKELHPSTKRWQSAIIAELSKQSLPFPPGLILAVIDVESNGVPGLVNHSSGASGLMQVMPSALESYNRSHAVKFTMNDMRSHDNGVAQIRVGMWLIGQFWRGAYHYLSQRLNPVPIDQIAKIADLFYAMGPGLCRKLLEKLPIPTFENFELKYPKSNALPHPHRVFDRMDITTLSPDLIYAWITTSAKTSEPAQEKKNWLTAAILTAIIGFVVTQLLKRFE
jgi:hypothetical protein